MRRIGTARREAARQDAIINRLVARHTRTLQRELAEAARDAARAYQRDASIDSAVRAHDDRIRDAFVAMARAGFEAFAMDTYRKITGAKSVQGMEYKQEDEVQIALNSAIDKYLQRWTAQKITQISSTTAKQIQRDVRRAMEDGLSVADTAALIARRGEELAGVRAAIIARTEIHGAANYGAIEAAKETGVVERKVWLAVKDDRTRGQDNDEFDHSKVAPAGLNEPFIIRNLRGGMDAMLQYPGDPAGPPGAVINCRCAMGWEV